MSKIQTISVIAFLAYSIIIGSLVFSRGFLLNRQITTDKAGPCLDTSYRHHYHDGEEEESYQERIQQKHELLGNLSEAASWCNQYPVFKKAILILVDALRHDFVGRMPFLSSVVQGQQNKDNEGALPNSQGKRRGRVEEEGKSKQVSSCMFRFIADPPTTTMQRLKALMTGTMPTFIDASANFNSYEVEEDSLIFQLNASGKKLAFLGDDTWLSLFPPVYFKSPIVEAHPSFNAWDLDTVDRAVNHSLRNKVFNKSNEWDVLIAHILGVDHCGHRYGPSHPEMQRKLNEADEIIEFVQNSMSDDTLLVVFGDHGMTHTGDHGGDSKDETDSAVIFISKQRRMNGGGMTTSSPSAFTCPSYSPGISQIDLVPTLATLLGVPIPYSSLGQLIPDFLTNKRELYTDAVSANAAQVNKYMQQFGIAGGTGLQEDFERLQEAFHSFQLSRTNHSARAKVNALAHRYLTEVKLLALSTWTQFNVPMIYTGVGIASLAIICLAMYLINVPTLLQATTKYSVLSWLWPSLPIWSVLWSFIKSDSSSSSRLLAIIISTVGGLAVFFLATGLKLLQSIGKPQNRQRNLEEKSFWDYGALLLYVATCLAMFSNSFVINEGYMLCSTLTFVVFLHVVFSSSSSNSSTTTPDTGNVLRGVVAGAKEDLSVLQEMLLGKRVKCSVICFVILGVLVRTCSIFFRCREELQECTEEYLLHKQLASLPEEWLVHKYVRYSIALVSLAIFVVAFRLWMLYQKCLFNKTPAAIIAKFIPTLLVVMLGVFWALQGLPFISTSATKLRPILNYFPWVFQATTVISLVLVWLKPMFFSGSAPPFVGQSLIFPAQIQSCSECAMSAKKIRMKTSIPTTNTTPNQNSNPQFKKTIGKQVPNGVTAPKINGLNKYIPNGTSKLTSHQNSEAFKRPESKSVFLEMEHQFRYDDMTLMSAGPNGFSTSILLLVTLVVILMTQITSVGMAPTVSIIIPYIVVCLVGIFRNQGLDSWCSVVAWTLASQYLFYGTGHQPIFSAIPWDSAFLSVTDGQMFTEAQGSWITWVRPGLAILGNLHVSQIIFSLTLPLLAYWTQNSSILCQHQQRKLQSCQVRRKKAYVLSGKFILLHGLKLLCCMLCAGYHRRHLMVWKIFAPKFIFEAISFIVTTFTVIFSLVFITRVDYLYHRNRHKWNPSPSTN